MAEAANAPQRKRRGGQDKGAWQFKILTGIIVVLLVGAGGWSARQYVSSAPARAEAAYQQGMRLMGTSDFKGAEASFTKALDIRPSAAAYYERGLARQNLKQNDQALEDFQQAIGRDGNMGTAHTALGIMYRERGDMAHAVSEFTAAIQASPSAGVYYQRGQLYDSMGDHEKAIADYNESIHEAPDSPYGYRARGIAREAMGDHEGAEQDKATANQLESPNLR